MQCRSPLRTEVPVLRTCHSYCDMSFVSACLLYDCCCRPQDHLAAALAPNVRGGGSDCHCRAGLGNQLLPHCIQCYADLFACFGDLGSEDNDEETSQPQSQPEHSAAPVEESKQRRPSLAAAGSDRRCNEVAAPGSAAGCGQAAHVHMTPLSTMLPGSPQEPSFVVLISCIMHLLPSFIDTSSVSCGTIMS